MNKLIVEFKLEDQWIETTDLPSAEIADGLEALFHNNGIKARIVTKIEIKRYSAWRRFSPDLATTYRLWRSKNDMEEKEKEETERIPESEKAHG